MSKPKVYLSGPMRGLQFEDADGWRQYVADRLRPEIVPVSPMRGKEYLKGQTIGGSYADRIMSTSRGIVARDFNDTTTADLILVNLLGAFERVSIGTVAEIAWAQSARVPVVLVIDIPDGDPNQAKNPHYHPMVTEPAGWITDDLDEALAAVKQILLPDPDPGYTTINIQADATRAGDAFDAANYQTAGRMYPDHNLGPAVAFPAPQDDDLVRVSGYVRRRPKAS